MDPMLAAVMEVTVPYPRPCEGMEFTAASPTNLLLITDELADFLEDLSNHPVRCGVHTGKDGSCTCGAMPLVHAYRHRRPAEPVGLAAGPRNLVYEIGLVTEEESARAV